MQNVLELMLYSYAFMVSGMFVPVIGLLVLKKPSASAAFVAMITGGLTTLILIVFKVNLPYNLDANVFGISLSAISFAILQRIDAKRHAK
jgi:SSS family solute:Na+ symporter